MWLGTLTRASFFQACSYCVDVCVCTHKPVSWTYRDACMCTSTIQKKVHVRARECKCALAPGMCVRGLWCRVCWVLFVSLCRLRALLDVSAVCAARMPLCVHSRVPCRVKESSRCRVSCADCGACVSLYVFRPSPFLLPSVPLCLCAPVCELMSLFAAAFTSRGAQGRGRVGECGGTGGVWVGPGMLRAPVLGLYGELIVNACFSVVLCVLRCVHTQCTRPSVRVLDVCIPGRLRAYCSRAQAHNRSQT